MVENNEGAAAETFNWPPLESNPEIFANYMKQCGLPENWTFGEIYGFEEDLLGFIPQPVVAVICNAEFLKKTEDRQKGDMTVANSYYMKQTEVLDNACGVIACIHAILNCLGDDKIKLTDDSTLSKFLAAAKDQTPAERATTLETFEGFQTVHRGFAAQGQSNQAEDQSEVKHHFTAFVINSAGHLIELDGCKQGPLLIKENCDDVLRGAVQELQRRLADGEVSESLSMMTINAAQ